MMRRLILGPMIAILLLLAVSAFGQENTSISDSSAQASLDGEATMPAETAGDQEAAYGAEEIDQMIQTIEGDSSSTNGAEGAALDLETTDETADASQTDQVANTPEDNSGSTAGAAGADQTSDTVKEAKEMDQMIQTIEADGSTNAEVDQSAGAASASGEGTTDQSVSVGTSPDEEGGNVPTGAVQDSGTTNQTKSADQVDQMIQTLVEGDENSASENATVQGNGSTNETGSAELAEPAEQPAQTPANGEVTPEVEATAVEQTEIQEKTKSLDILIQNLANNETSTGMATTESTGPAETIEKTKTIDQAIQTLADYGDEADGGGAVGSSEGAGGQDTEGIEIADEGNSMDEMIQALEGSDIIQ